ncbi:MAG TPA: hypothetical protein VD930_10045 [Gemmatimonadales bacterium]|nr:hypothetical protein [Gemmatimonadales bacterium]
MINPHRALLLAAFATSTIAGCKRGSDSASGGAATASGAATTTELAISEIQLGKKLSADKRVAQATTTFSPRDTIYAVALTQGSSPNTTVTARWTYEDGGQVVKEDSRTIAPSGNEATEFHISKPSGWPKGKYRVTLTAGGSTESKDFVVR